MKKYISYILTAIITVILTWSIFYFYQNKSPQMESELLGYKKQVQLLKEKIEISEKEKKSITDELKKYKDNDDLLSYISKYKKIRRSDLASSFASAEIKINRIPNGWKVFLYEDGLGDDSIRGIKYSLILKEEKDGSLKLLEDKVIERLYWKRK